MSTPELRIANLVVNKIFDQHASDHYNRAVLDQLKEVVNRTSPGFSDRLNTQVRDFMNQACAKMDPEVNRAAAERIVAASWLYSGDCRQVQQEHPDTWIKRLSKNDCPSCEVAKRSQWMEQLGWYKFTQPTVSQKDSVASEDTGESCGCSK